MSTLLILLWSCANDNPIPAGDWANVAPARAAEVVPFGELQLVRVEEASWDFWVRLPADPIVKPGDALLLGRGAPVKLVVDDRRFDDVLALDAFAVVTPEIAARALALPDLPADRTPIATLHADRLALAGQPVRAAGRIVKASMNVFGTNWYHIQDGSGSADDGDDDLTFTSPAVLDVGDVVIAAGPLTTDKNLGFGYFYPVILEGAEMHALDGTSLGAATDATLPDAGPQKEIKPFAKRTEPLPTQGPTAPGGRVVHGLELGVATDAEVQAWTAGLQCAQEPALARRTLHTRCRAANARWPAPGSPTTEVLVARPEEQAAIHHLSAVRVHDEPIAAIADWQQAVDAATARVGEPLSLRAPTPDATLTGRLTYSATWRYDDLEVGLSVMRLRPDGPVTVRERWFVPGVEESLEDRGVGVHGAGVRSAPNPHRVR